jgi:hypothetical protein
MKKYIYLVFVFILSSHSIESQQKRWPKDPAKVIIPNFNEPTSHNKQHKAAKQLTLDNLANTFSAGIPGIKPFIRVILDPHSTLNQKSYAVLETGLFFMPQKNVYVGIDGMDPTEIRQKYFEFRQKNPKEALTYAQAIFKEAERCDSIHGSVVAVFTRGDWEYQLCHLNPKWTENDCYRILHDELWIGMTLRMVCYEYKQYPDKDNVSDYGQGREHQWVFEDHNPSCFYGGDDEIITSYN